MWRTVAFTPDTTGWNAIYKNDDGTLFITPIAGWLLQEETRVDSNRDYSEWEGDGPRETRVVAGDIDEDRVEPCADCNNFQGLRLRSAGEPAPKNDDQPELEPTP